MIIKDKIGYSYNDLTVVPAQFSRVDSRKKVNPYIYGKTLPLFASPMSTVVCPENVTTWEDNGIIPIVPRNVDIKYRINWMKSGRWVALSLSEANKIFCEERQVFPNKVRICIDIANGHMQKLINVCSLIKFFYNDKVEIMTGNIANPLTIINMDKAKIDYVRCGIGGGAGCTTTSNVGVHYPMGSLIDECRNIKVKNNLNIKIVADGGIRNFNDVIKALGLGADYVMIGSVFASFFESAAPFVDCDINHLNSNLSEDEKRYFLKTTRYKEFYGMSTKTAQKMIKNEAELKTAEGVHKILTCQYTIKQWVENMTDYLRSAMSYTDKFDIQDFIGNVDLIINSISEIQAVNK